jgi:hypothetical protein
MEATASIDDLLGNISQIIYSKIEKQKFDPNFLQNLITSLVKKVITTDTTKIPSTPDPKKESKPFAQEMVEGYIQLAQDSQYREKYKEFLKKVYTREIKDAVSGDAQTKSSNISQYSENKKPRLIKEEEKPQKFILVDIAEKATRTLREKFKDIFNNFLDKFKSFFEKDPKRGGFGLLGGALALLLGGLAALVAGLMTDGPFKGLLKILSKVGIQGALKALEIAAKFFMANLKAAIMAPINLIQGFAKNIGQIFGKGAYKTLLGFIRPLKGIFNTILKNIGRVILFGVRRIPLVGSIISMGFAVSRFMKGDIIGGTIDTLSALAGLLYLTPAAPLAFPLILGLDVLNAVLDFKGGGSTEGATKRKAGVLWGWIKGLGLLIYKGVKSLPVIGPAIKAIEEFSSGNILKGIKQLAYIITPLEFIGALLGDKEASGLTKTTASVFRGVGGFIGKLGKWLGTAIYRTLKSLPIIGPAIKSVEELTKGNYLKALKQFAYIATPLEFIGALLGDTEASGMTKTTASIFRGVGSILKSMGEWIATTIWKIFSNLPVVGPALRGAKELFSGNFKEAFKQFLYVMPPFEMLGALLGDNNVGGIASAGVGMVKGIGSVLKKLSLWVKEKILNLPILGPLIKMVNNFAAGEWKEGLKNLGRAIGLGGLISFFESKFEESGGVVEQINKNPFTALREALLAKARKWWKNAWSWVRWLARRVLPTSVIKALDQEANEKIETEISPDKGPQGGFSLSNAFNKLKTALKGALEKVGQTISNVTNSVKEGAKSIIDTGINAAKSLSQTLKNTKDKVFEKVSGFFKNMTSNITTGVKNWWNNLSWDPKTWVGQSSIQKTPLTQPSIPTTTQASTKTENLNTVASRIKPENNITETKSKDDAKINNNLLNDIANNTDNTNNSLNTLNDVLMRLIAIMERKTSSTNSNNISLLPILNLAKANDIPGASKISQMNNDPIRAIRTQYV